MWWVVTAHVYMEYVHEMYQQNVMWNVYVICKMYQVYVVGGDGTHRGANAISREAAKRK